MLRWLFGGFFKKTLKEAAVEEDDFDEFQSSLSSMYKSMDDLEKSVERINKIQNSIRAENMRLNIEYEIEYNDNFSPEQELQMCYYNASEKKFIDYDYKFQCEPVDDYRLNEIESISEDYSCHEMRMAVWEVEYNEKAIKEKNKEFDLERDIALFQFSQEKNEYLNSFEKSKVGKLEITKINGKTIS